MNDPGLFKVKFRMKQMPKHFNLNCANQDPRRNDSYLDPRINNVSVFERLKSSTSVLTNDKQIPNHFQMKFSTHGPIRDVRNCEQDMNNTTVFDRLNSASSYLTNAKHVPENFPLKYPDPNSIRDARKVNSVPLVDLLEDSPERLTNTKHVPENFPLKYPDPNLIRDAGNVNSVPLVDLLKDSPERLKNTKTIDSNGLAKSNFHRTLEGDIHKFYLRNVQPQRMKFKKVDLCNRLHHLFLECKLGTSDLFLVGSSMSGSASKTSDADMCIFMNDDITVARKISLRILRRVTSVLRSRRNHFKKVEYIAATVPIVKFTDIKSGIDCDLNVNSLVGIRNTHLLKAYGDADARVNPLVFAIKYWARARGINNASTGTLSSYSITLMVINFLQVGVSPPLLTSLQSDYPSKFLLETPVHSLPSDFSDIKSSYKTENTMSVGQLFFEFIHYYHKFSFEDNIISVRKACVLPKTKACLALSKWQKHISIEEPFDNSNTARAVHNSTKYLLIKKEFRKTAQQLERNISYMELLNQY